MQFSLNMSCVRHLVAPPEGGEPFVRMDDLPKYVRESLGLHGVNVTTDLLAGATRARLERFRERADKAACACLALIEPEAQPFGHRDDNKGIAAIERTGRVIRAANVLGCSSAVIALEAGEGDEVFEIVIERMKEVAEIAERLDMNVLIAPREGLTAEPERVTELIKRVGGFRIGTMPDFEVATKHGEAELYLRRLTPYAAMVTAATIDFRLVEEDESAPPSAAGSGGDAPPAEADVDAEGDEDEDLGLGGFEKLMAMLDEPGETYAHEPYDLGPLVQSVVSVGYDGMLAIDYRGQEEVTLGILRSVECLEAALEGVAGK